MVNRCGRQLDDRADDGLAVERRRLERGRCGSQQNCKKDAVHEV